MENMSNTVVERYVKALFALCKEQEQLERLEKDVHRLQQAYSLSEAFQTLCKTRRFSKEEKAETLEVLAKELSLSDLVRKFLGVLAVNGRSALLEACLQTVKDLLQQHKGVLSVAIISATPLTKTQKDKICQSVEKSVQSHIEVKTEVDPNLLGGFLVKTGSQIYDASIRTKLEDLRTLMKEA